MRVKIEISYLGDNYSGFQIQSNKKTIQGEIEKVLFDIFNYKISIVASGRTDAGVSALCQVAHFDIGEYNDVSKLYKRMNSMLPQDIKILSSEMVAEDWHARYSSKRKTYCYNFYVSDVEIPYYDAHALNVGTKIDIEKMQDACKFLIGEHDFSAFCASNTNVVNKTRTIYEAKIIKLNENSYAFEVSGNGFLYNMVRIIVGTLFQIGMSKLTLLEFKNVIDNKDRSKAGRTAPSKGLYLKSVCYED